MGIIEIRLSGSFGTRNKTFSALEVGHAQALANAIAFIAETEMPKAIKNDHECQTDGIKPSRGFGGLS